MKLSNKQLKKLLHTQRQDKSQQDEEKGQKNNDDRLHIRYVSTNDIKKEGGRSPFNRIRRENAKTELNQFEHVESQHIRLKPYYDSDILIHWVGIVSDITIPRRASQTEGSILIDKVSTLDHKDLFDYHLWLNVVSIKFMRNDKIQVGIGDYIEGISSVKMYGQNKYGLDTTAILSCGIYFGISPDRCQIYPYDHGDDWVLQMQNSTASLRARRVYNNHHSMAEASKEIGHVASKYQPSRYHNYQERLEQDSILDEKPLPLISDKYEYYQAVAIKPYAFRTIKDNEYKYQPMISIGEIVNEHKRVVAQSANLPYTHQLANHGLIQKGQWLTIRAKRGKSGQLFEIDRIDTLNMATVPKESTKAVPTDSEALAGYLLYVDNKEGDMKTPQGKKCVEKFLAWAREKEIDPSSLKQITKEWKDDGTYNAKELAHFLRIPQGWIENLVKQHILIPLNDVSDVDTMKFSGQEINKLHQLMQANTDLLRQEIVKQYHFYRAKDIAKQLNLTEKEVADIITTTPYKSFNKFYGANVLDIVKEQVAKQKETKLKDEVKRSLLNKFGSNRQGIKVKREIPKDKMNAFDAPTKPKQDTQATEPEPIKTTKTATSIKQNNLPVPVASPSEPKQEQLSLLDSSATPVDTPNKHKSVYNLFQQRNVIFKNNKTAERFQSQKTTIKTTDKPQTAHKPESNLRVSILSTSGNYYTDQFATAEEAKQFFESPLKPMELNRFVNAKDKQGNEKSISVRNILEWYVDE